MISVFIRLIAHHIAPLGIGQPVVHIPGELIERIYTASCDLDHAVHIYYHIDGVRKPCRYFQYLTVGIRCDIRYNGRRKFLRIFNTLGIFTASIQKCSRFPP